MARSVVWMLVSVAVLLSVVARLVVRDSREGRMQPLLVFCAASHRAAMDEIRDDFLAREGCEIEVQYGASQSLLSAIEVSRTGDVYLPADALFLRLAEQKDLIETSQSVARMNVVALVASGNPKGIRQFDDLLRDDVRLVMASATTSALGRRVRESLIPRKLWRPLDDAADAERTTVTEAANDVAVGAADVSLVYDAVAVSYPQLQTVSFDELATARSLVSAGTLRWSDQTEAGNRFLRYLASDEGGRWIFGKHGFDVEELPNGRSSAIESSLQQGDEVDG